MPISSSVYSLKPNTEYMCTGTRGTNIQNTHTKIHKKEVNMDVQQEVIFV